MTPRVGLERQGPWRLLIGTIWLVRATAETALLGG